MERRIAASPPGVCPVDLTHALLKMSQVQTCGKCTPCRVGLQTISKKLEKITNHEATMEDLEEIKRQANQIASSADCMLGVNAAKMVISSLEGFAEDYEAHIKEHHCTYTITKSIPCVAGCPANVDIPAYIQLVEAERYADVSERTIRFRLRAHSFVSIRASIAAAECSSTHL